MCAFACVCVVMSSEDEDDDSIKNPLEDVTAGLLDSSGQRLPLQAVHVKCKLMDLLSQVRKKTTLLTLSLPDQDVHSSLASTSWNTSDCWM